MFLNFQKVTLNTEDGDLLTMNWTASC